MLQPRPADARPREAHLRAVRRGAAYGVLLLTLALTAVTIVIPSVAGAVPLTVLSGSMSPTMPVGSLAIVRPTMPTIPHDELTVMTPAQVREINDVSRLRIGDVVAFLPHDGQHTMVMHRVVDQTASHPIGGGAGRSTYITQGDALDTSEEVHDHMVRGVVWYSLPWLGWVNQHLNASHWHTPLAITIVVVGYGSATVYAMRAVRAGRRQPTTASP